MTRKEVLPKLASTIQLSLLALLPIALQAQVVVNYDFAQDPGTFTSLTSGTTLASGANLDDQVSAAITIPTFYFNNTPYTQVYVSANGFVTFGSAPAGNNYTPLSTAGAYTGAISAFGTDLTSRAGGGQSGTRDVRYQQVGDEFIVEWRQVRRKSLTEWFSFQIRLNTATHVIKMVYGAIGQGPDAAVTLQPQVGLQGGTTLPSNVKNRRVGTGNETWSSSLPGNAITSTMRFTSTAPAKSFTAGTTYTFTPTTQDCLGIPGGPAQPGTACNDGDPDTENDTWSNDCICVGTPINVCTEELTLEIQTDANGGQTSWEILNETGMTIMCDGSGYPSSSTVTATCCLPDGCYILRFYDSAGDGMSSGNNGGYILRTYPENRRIIDNRNNFLDGSVSAIANNLGFCLPIGTDRVIFTSCDKLDWVSDQFIVASLNPAVSAEWIDGAPNSAQSSNTGYEFWFFDPNGSYSFRWFRGHNTSHGYGVGPARAAHLRINNWLAAVHIPEQVLMNVRVRSRVNGVNSAWGPACRFMIDPVAAACPTTKLLDIPGHQFISCGQYREWAFNSYVHAVPVSGATQYQFRFRQPAEGYERIRTNTSYFVQLWWTNDPLVDGSQYEVDVRAMVNGEWCPWGDICTLNIGVAPGMLSEGANTKQLSTSSISLNIWPNPNRGDQLSISLGEVPEGISTVSIDMFDMSGRRVMARTIPVNDASATTILELDNGLSTGMYMINLTAGTLTHTQRLVIQP